MLIFIVLGISTDGGSNMCSVGEGCFGHIQKENERNIFQGCASHRLNLAMKDVCGSGELIHLFRVINDFAVLTKDSYKRMEKWSDIVTELHRNHKNEISLSKKPQAIGATRWSGKFKALNGSIKNPTSFIAMFKCLFSICNSEHLKPKKKESQEKVQAILDYWCEFENIMRAVVVNNILAVIEKTTH